MTNTALQSLKALQNEINLTLPELAKKLGLKELKISKGKYDPTNGSFSIVIEGTVEGGQNKEETYYNQIRLFHSELPELKTTFQHKGEMYSIVGANSRGSKILAENLSNGKKYLFGLDYVKLIFKVR